MTVLSDVTNVKNNKSIYFVSSSVYVSRSNLFRPLSTYLLLCFRGLRLGFGGLGLLSSDTVGESPWVYRQRPDLSGGSG